MLPRGGKNRARSAPLCISEVFRGLSGPKSSTFLHRMPHRSRLPQSSNRLRHAAGRSAFYTYCNDNVYAKTRSLSRQKHCLDLVQRNMLLNQDANKTPKWRFTKVFSFLSTVLVDNFVDNGLTSPFHCWDKVYLSLILPLGRQK